MALEHLLHGGHRALELAVAFRFIDDGEAGMAVYCLAESRNAVDSRARRAVLEQQDIRVTYGLQQMLGAGAASRIIVRLDGRDDGAAVLDVRVNRDDRDAGCACCLECRPHALEIDGVEEDNGDALGDEVLDLFRLLLNGEGRVAREQDIAVVLDLRADLFVDDLVERIVERHVDGAEFLLVLLLLGAEVVLRRIEDADGEADENDGSQDGEQSFFPEHDESFLDGG